MHYNFHGLTCSSLLLLLIEINQENLSKQFYVSHILIMGVIKGLKTE